MPVDEEEIWGMRERRGKGLCTQPGGGWSRRGCSRSEAGCNAVMVRRVAGRGVEGSLTVNKSGERGEEDAGRKEAGGGGQSVEEAGWRVKEEEDERRGGGRRKT